MVWTGNLQHTSTLCYAMPAGQRTAVMHVISTLSLSTLLRHPACGGVNETILGRTTDSPFSHPSLTASFLFARYLPLSTLAPRSALAFAACAPSLSPSILGHVYFQTSPIVHLTLPRRRLPIHILPASCLLPLCLHRPFLYMHSSS